MKVVGYSDRLSVAPGEEIRFMVSCELPSYRAEIVRLIHGDPNPDGPGVKEQPVATPVSGDYPGQVQRIPRGSHVLVPNGPALAGLESFTLAAWIFPTTPGRGEQGLLGRWSDPERRGFALVLDAAGELALWLGRPGGEVERVASGAPLRAGRWYFVAAAFDAPSGRVTLVQEPAPAWPVEAHRATVQRQAAAGVVAEAATPLVMAGLWAGAERARTLVRAHYNGKLEAPCLFRAALGLEQLAALQRGTPPAELGAPLAAAWDFALDTPTDRVRDVSGNGLDGQVVNMPARAMTGHTYRGDEPSWVHAPREHGAIHFHDDDLEDAGWEVGFSLVVPDDLPSGVYAARLSAGDAVDHLPFFVRPRGRRASAPILFLAPTNSYLAYANYHGLENPAEREAWNAVVDFPVTDEDRYMCDEQLLSCYDLHSDGSGVCYSSWLRPIVSVRPAMREWLLGEGHGYPHQLSADLHLVDWLVARGFRFDVATDRDLHEEGVELLSQYRVVLTGSHAEYWSAAMLDALEAYQQRGGRFMYLSGNGLYWVTSYAPDRTHVIEIRRWGGTQAWTARPGENYHSTTGELGGLWRNRGRAPQRYVGVGFTSQGFDRSLPYQRQPGSFDPRAAWIFAGIGPDEPIGGFGLVMHGACGFEVDRTDPALGTPPHALLLASATAFSDSYQHVVEEVQQSNSRQGGSVNPLVRGEMVFYETPNGGAVFSTGSISYCGSLSHNGYDNNVSRLTENVLRRFLDPAPFA